MGYVTDAISCMVYDNSKPMFPTQLGYVTDAISCMVYDNSKPMFPTQLGYVTDAISCMVYDNSKPMFPTQLGYVTDAISCMVYDNSKPMFPTQLQPTPETMFSVSKYATKASRICKILLLMGQNMKKVPYGYVNQNLANVASAKYDYLPEHLKQLSIVLTHI